MSRSRRGKRRGKVAAAKKKALPARAYRINWETPGLVLGLVVAIHITMAFISGDPGIHTGGDNAAYVSLAQSLAQDGAYHESWHPGSPPHTQYPPVYPAVLAVLILLGAKTWGVFKAMSLLGTALATAFCFLWVRRLHGPRIAGVVALFFGISPALLFHSRWILSEPLFLTFVFASLWLLTPDSRKPVRTAESGTALSWLARPRCIAALALVITANFTRSAGLPLVAAVGIWLAMRKRWATLGIFSAAFAAFAIPWHLRSGGEYVSAFWLVNPYALDQGTIDLGGLVTRLGTNLWEYTIEYVPTGLTGMSGIPAAVLGLVTVGLALAGWLHRVRSGPGLPEIFTFLYTGLIMVWPAAWSGDRFALPLYPLILLYGGEQLVRTAARLPRRVAQAVAVAVAAIVVVPAGASWLEDTEYASRCRALVANRGPMGCYASSIRELQVMALWTREWLPPGSVVFARKPRLFHAFSGHPAVVYPFTSDPNRLPAQADSIGVDYVVVGSWDTSGPAYVLPAVSAHRDRFCLVKALRAGPGPAISLWAIRAQGTNGTPAEEESEGELRMCPGPGWEDSPSSASLASMTVPILDRE